MIDFVLWMLTYLAGSLVGIALVRIFVWYFWCPKGTKLKDMFWTRS